MSDLISRQAAIEYLMTNMCWYNEDGYEETEDEKRNAITDLINGVPSAQPEIVLELLKTQPTIEPRKGKWKEHKDYPGLAYLCSECGYFTTMRTNFCPNCGADMREVRTE
jgi:rubrerythrin